MFHSAYKNATTPLNRNPFKKPTQNKTKIPTKKSTFKKKNRQQKQK